MSASRRTPPISSAGWGSTSSSRGRAPSPSTWSTAAAACSTPPTFSAPCCRTGTPRCGMVTASEGNADWRAKGERPCPDSGAAVLLELSPRPGTGFGSFAFLTRSEYADMDETVVSLAEARGRLRARRAPGLEDRWLEMAGPVRRRGAETGWTETRPDRPGDPGPDLGGLPGPSPGSRSACRPSG